MSEMVERRVREAVETAFAQIRETLNREVAEEIISYRELKAGVNNAAVVVQAALDALTPSKEIVQPPGGWPPMNGRGF